VLTASSTKNDVAIIDIEHCQTNHLFKFKPASLPVQVRMLVEVGGADKAEEGGGSRKYSKINGGAPNHRMPRFVSALKTLNT